MRKLGQIQPKSIVNGDAAMFGLFKSDPSKKLNEQYHAKLEAAMQAQRKGDIRLHGELTAEAEKLYSQIQALQTKA